MARLLEKYKSLPTPLRQMDYDVPDEFVEYFEKTVSALRVQNEQAIVMLLNLSICMFELGSRTPWRIVQKVYTQHNGAMMESRPNPGATGIRL